MMCLLLSKAWLPVCTVVQSVIQSSSAFFSPGFAFLAAAVDWLVGMLDLDS